MAGVDSLLGLLPKLHSQTRIQTILLVLGVLFSFLGAAMLILLGQKSSLPVAHIEVSGNAVLEKEEILARVHLSVGEVYARSDLDAAAEALLALPWLKKADIDQEGDLLRIAVVEKRCLATIKRDAQNFSDVLEGMLVVTAAPPRCLNPLITGRPVAEAGELLDRDARKLIQDWETLRQRYPELASRFSEVSVRPNGRLTLYTRSPVVQIELSSSGLDAANAERLYAAISFLEQERKGAGLLDLRGPDGIFVPRR